MNLIDYNIRDKAATNTYFNFFIFQDLGFAKFLFTGEEG